MIKLSKEASFEARYSALWFFNDDGTTGLIKVQESSKSIHRLVRQFSTTLNLQFESNFLETEKYFEKGHENVI